MGTTNAGFNLRTLGGDQMIDLRLCVL